MPTNTPECAGYLMLREKLEWENESVHHAACYGAVNWNFEDKYYCLMHAPVKEKIEEFNKAVEEKFAAKNYNFYGAWFPANAHFSGYNFNGEVYFTYAQFHGSTFFMGTQFSGEKAEFYGAQFSGGYADFSLAKFSGKADFSRTRFDRRASFIETQFHDAYFNEAQFNAGKADFRKAHFDGDASFARAQFSGRTVNFDNAEFTGRNTDFSRVQFGGIETRFKDAKFSGGKASFYRAEFTAGGAEFDRAEFGGGNVTFRRAKFRGGDARFDHVKFTGGDVNFRRAEFGKTARFDLAQFTHKAAFGDAVFEKAVFFDRTVFTENSFIDFSLTRFMDFARFMECDITGGAEMYFGEVIFEKPERVHFHSIANLQPRWFINLDTRKFNFEKTRFPILRTNNTVKTELRATLKLLNRLNDDESEYEFLPYGLLTTACHRLAANAEENNRYSEASDFRRMAFETERLQRGIDRKAWFGKLNDSQITGIGLRSFSSDAGRSWAEIRKLRKEYPSGVLQFFYRWLSDYSESWAWAFFCMVLIWLGFGAFYGVFSPGSKKERLFRPGILVHTVTACW